MNFKYLKKANRDYVGNIYLLNYSDTYEDEQIFNLNLIESFDLSDCTKVVNGSTQSRWTLKMQSQTTSEFFPSFDHKFES